MPDSNSIQVAGDLNATHLIRQYEDEYRAMRSTLKLDQQQQRLRQQKDISPAQIFIGIFLSLSAVSTILGGTYLDSQVQWDPQRSDRTPAAESWVFPVYFMAGMFSVSSILVFRKAVR
ncbi:hypothetical protein [Lyngbya confervoides]|uniref:Uncharacterized protein n=1 Tax=Lyngbya confervoides BDU141951 TaxID=1574623 RepID=A0ABD4T873_9CYAN|nr:hypothetical protein [Lyngbya confervoides]MCM1984816.1 hypothetical protein [Lyngbya confervoides BDU141951]